MYSREKRPLIHEADFLIFEIFYIFALLPLFSRQKIRIRIKKKNKISHYVLNNDQLYSTSTLLCTPYE